MFTHFKTTRVTSSATINHTGNFTGDIEECIDYQTKKLGLTVGERVETEKYIRVTGYGGRLAVVAYK